MSGGAVEKSCNLDYLLGNLGGNMGAAKRLIGMYLNNHPNLLHMLDQAVERADLRCIRQVVHDIRGSCVLFSAGPCLRLARSIEEALRAPVDEIVPLSGSEMPAWAKDCLELRQALVLMAEELQRVMESE